MRTLSAAARVLCSALVLFLAACGDPPGGPPDGGQGGGGGAGGGSGGGTGGGAGAPLTFLGPTGPRRGPVALGFALDESQGALSGFTLRLDGGAPATVKAVERDGGALTLVWSSFDDVAQDLAQGLSLQASQGVQAVSTGFTVELRNAPDPVRLVAVAHNLQARDAGGVEPQGTGVSLFSWDGGQPGTPRRLTVGRGPSDLVAAPHGRAFAVVEDSAGTLSLLKTPLDGDPAGASVQGPVSLPWGSATDARFSPDGRTLYVLGTSAWDGGVEVPGQAATLWAFTPAEDLSSVGVPRALATLARPPMQLDVDRSSGRILVAVGAGPVTGAVSRLHWFEPDGTPAAAPYDFDFSVVNDLAVAPKGGLALSTSDLFGDELFLYSLGSAGPVHVQTSGAVAIPYHLVFHPASTATAACALVTGLNSNTVTPVLVTPTGVTARPSLGAVSLAAELDLVERGGLVGTAVVSSVSKVARVRFNVDGTGSTPSTLLDFGAGVTNITGAVGVQR